MANGNGATPQFQLNGTQMLALHLIEGVQNQLTWAANACAGKVCNEPDAGKLLAEAARIIEASKLEWLQMTQRAIRVVAAIPGKLNGSGLIQP